MNFLEILICLVIGYLLGSLSPSALLSRVKKVNFREKGTGNLGASNTMIILGKGYGAFVMLFDILKAYFASKLAKLLFPQLALAGLIAGFAAVVGHVFPFYLRFQGGKGLAAFGGMVLAYKPWLFLGLLTFGLILMAIVNYSYVMPMSAAVLFALYVALTSGDVWATLLAIAASLLVIVKHWSNIGKAKRGEETGVREVVRSKPLTKIES